MSEEKNVELTVTKEDLMNLEIALEHYLEEHGDELPEDNDMAGIHDDVKWVRTNFKSSQVANGGEN